MFVPGRSDQVELSGDDCHFVIAPTFPLRVIVVPLPLQRVPAVGVAVPPTATGLTVTVVAPAIEAQLLTVAVTLYSPLAAVVTLLTDGFCWAEVNPFGPLQL